MPLSIYGHSNTIKTQVKNHVFLSNGPGLKKFNLKDES